MAMRLLTPSRNKVSAPELKRHLSVSCRMACPGRHAFRVGWLRRHALKADGSDSADQKPTTVLKPPFRTLWKLKVKPCKWAICLIMENPSPLPFCFCPAGR